MHSTQLFNLKTALDAGGSRGIARAIFAKLAEQSAHLIIIYKENKQASLETLRLATDLGAHGII